MPVAVLRPSALTNRDDGAEPEEGGSRRGRAGRTAAAAAAADRQCAERRLRRVPSLAARSPLLRDPAPYIRIALYDDHGGSSTKNGVLNARGAADFDRILRSKAWTADGRPYQCIRLSAAAIRGGALLKGSFSALVHPGGEGCAQGRALGPDGMQRVREFVAQGGGFVGICAGANLASSDPNYGSHTLGLLPTRTLDSTDEYPAVKHLRGQGMVDVEISQAGQVIFDTSRATVTVDYINGPLIEPADPEDAGPFPDPLRPASVVCLANYAGEVAATKYGRSCRGSKSRRMGGKCAAVAGVYGNGRVVCIGPHPEKMNGPQWMVRGAVAWATKCSAVDAPRGAAAAPSAATPRAAEHCAFQPAAPARPPAGAPRVQDLPGLVWPSCSSSSDWPSSTDDEEFEEEDTDDGVSLASAGTGPRAGLLGPGSARQVRPQQWASKAATRQGSLRAHGRPLLPQESPRGESSSHRHPANPGRRRSEPTTACSWDPRFYPSPPSPLEMSAPAPRLRAPGSRLRRDSAASDPRAGSRRLTGLPHSAAAEQLSAARRVPAPCASP